MLGAMPKPGFSKGRGNLIVQGQMTAKVTEQLSKHKRHKILDLFGTKLKSLEVLTDFPWIEELRLYRTKISDFTGLETLPKLHTLFFNGTNEDRFDFLQKLPKLTHLSILRAPKLERFPELSSAHEMQYLCLHICKRLAEMSSIASLQHLQALDILETAWQEPSDFEDLLAATAAKYVRVQFGTRGRNEDFDKRLEHHGKQRYPSSG